MSFSTLYGSKWVAIRWNTFLPMDDSGFSTLYGSKWVATYITYRQALNTAKFQYPLRVEVGCKLGTLTQPMTLK